MNRQISHPSKSIDREDGIFKNREVISSNKESMTKLEKPSEKLSVASNTSGEEQLFGMTSDEMIPPITEEEAKTNVLESIKLWSDLLLHVGDANENNKTEFDKKRVAYFTSFASAQNLDIFGNDHEFTRQAFFGCLDILDIPIVHRFLEQKSWSTVSDAVMESNIYLLANILVMIVEFVPFHDDDLSSRYDTLLNAIRIHIKQAARPTSADVKRIHEVLLSFIWNLSDRTLVVPSLIRTGFAKSVSEWFVVPNLSIKERRSMISIIHNLSRHDQGADELNKQNTIKILKDWQEEECPEKWELSFLKMMALAHLYTPEQIKDDLSDTHSILDQLLQVTMNAKSDSRYRFSGFHISETLSVLVKIFVNDSIMDYVLNHAKTDPPSNATSTIYLFSDLTIEFLPSISKSDQLEQFTFIALCNIIWSISFHEIYHPILKQHTKFIEMMKKLAQTKNLNIVEQYVPRTMLNIKQAADGILFNLNMEEPSASLLHFDLPLEKIEEASYEKKKSILNRLPFRSKEPQAPPPILKPIAPASVCTGPIGPPPMDLESEILSPAPPPRQKSEEKPLVMISYCHANNEFCDKILELLDQKADVLDVWIDRRYCKSSGDVWESIARGIKSAQLIICIVSTEYLASKACRQEVIYAKDRLNKPFLPVYVEKPIVSEWLDIRLAEFKYVRFQNTNAKLDERKVQEFLSTLMESILPGHDNSTDIPIVHHSQSKTTLIHSSDPELTPKPVQTRILTQARSGIQVENPTLPQWTTAEIHRWFDENQISSDIRDLYDFKTGAQMLAYAECFLDGWQKQYDRYAPRYAERYKGKELSEHEFALFATALKELYVKQYGKSAMKEHSNPKSHEPTLTTGPQQSCWCVLL